MMDESHDLQAVTERIVRAGLVVELVDGVSGAPVARGVRLRVILPLEGRIVSRAALTPSGRHVFRAVPADQPVEIEALPEGAPFLPERLSVGPGEPPRLARLCLTPARDYPFGPGERVIRRQLLADGKPLPNVTVGVGPGFLAPPSRTDSDGEFALLLLPAASGRQNGAARPAGPPELVFRRGEERRRLADPGETEEPIAWETLQKLGGPG